MSQHSTSLPGVQVQPLRRQKEKKEKKKRKKKKKEEEEKKEKDVLLATLKDRYNIWIF